jgi:hypothetical protein
MEFEREVDTAPGGLTVWRGIFGGSIIWGQLKFFFFIAAFIIVGGTIVALAPI